jgi:hypothetical protein
MSEKKQTCENCIYWKAVLDANGVCRRYPPRVFILKDGIDSTEWPKTSKDSWCGEHSLRCVIYGCEGCYDREGSDL